MASSHPVQPVRPSVIAGWLAPNTIVVRMYDAGLGADVHNHFDDRYWD